MKVSRLLFGIDNPLPVFVTPSRRPDEVAHHIEPIVKNSIKISNTPIQDYGLRDKDYEKVRTVEIVQLVQTVEVSSTIKTS